LTASIREAYKANEKRGELRRLAATQNKQLNSSASSKNEPKNFKTDLKSRVVWRGIFIWSVVLGQLSVVCIGN
jgi:hypothetical protein